MSEEKVKTIEIPSKFFEVRLDGIHFKGKKYRAKMLCISEIGNMCEDCEEDNCLGCPWEEEVTEK